MAYREDNMFRLIKRIFRWLYMYPIREDDLKCPIRVFAWDCYTGHYGVCVLRSGKNEPGIVNKEDVVVWLSPGKVKLWPENMRKASSIEISQRHG